jgi:hypothetical protein
MRVAGAPPRPLSEAIERELAAQSLKRKAAAGGAGVLGPAGGLQPLAYSAGGPRKEVEEHRVRMESAWLERRWGPYEPERSGLGFKQPG